MYQIFLYRLSLKLSSYFQTDFADDYQDQAGLELSNHHDDYALLLASPNHSPQEIPPTAEENDTYSTYEDLAARYAHYMEADYDF